MDPGDLGVHSWRMSKIWNMTQPSQVDFLNVSEHIWSGKPMYSSLMEQIKEVVALGTHSLKREHQIKQKQLYLDLALIMKSFKKTGDSKHWADFILKMNGPRPINPIFRNFLKVHEPVDVKDEERWKTWYPSSETANTPTEEEVDDVQHMHLPHNKFKPTRKIVNQREDDEDDKVDYGDGSGSSESATETEEPQQKPAVTKEPEVKPAPEAKSEYSYSYEELEQDARPQSKSMARKETSASSGVQLVENPWTLAVVEQDWKNRGQTQLSLDPRRSKT